MVVMCGLYVQKKNDARNSYENIESGEMMSEKTQMC